MDIDVDSERLGYRRVQERPRRMITRRPIFARERCREIIRVIERVLIFKPYREIEQLKTIILSSSRSGTIAASTPLSRQPEVSLPYHFNEENERLRYADTAWWDPLETNYNKHIQTIRLFFPSTKHSDKHPSFAHRDCPRGIVSVERAVLEI